MVDLMEGIVDIYMEEFSYEDIVVLVVFYELFYGCCFFVVLFMIMSKL